MGKRTFIIFVPFVSFLLCGYVFSSFLETENQDAAENREDNVRDILQNEISLLQQYISDTLIQSAQKIETKPLSLQKTFIHARALYKKFEWAAEYFAGSTAQLINGPPVPEVDNADLLDPVMSRSIEPTGFQVMEEFLFPEVDTSKKNELLDQLHFMEKNVGFFKTYFNNIALPDWRILDAAKLEIFRILTLGITGFDTPLTLKGINESAIAISSLKNIMILYGQHGNNGDLLDLLDSATGYLLSNNDFDSFDRAYFITEFGNPLSALITNIENNFGYPLRYNRMLRQEASSLFDAEAFNVNAFAPGKEYFMTNEKAELGKKLFFDTHLSGTGTRSCGSCHLPDKGWADGLTKNTALYDSNRLLPRNTPTVSYAALQSNQFYDMRALTLEDQANDVVHNPDELDGSFQNILKYLQGNDDYKYLFARAFPEKKDKTIDSAEVLNALASHIRSLTKFNSRFDQYMRGDKSTLNKKEIDGFNLFMGKAKCATCHFMPIFNGITPPKYTVNDAEIIGVPKSLTDSIIDPDPGWSKIIGVDYFEHSFKTPGIRNIAETAPYMHNGVYNTLEEVMEFYNNGGGVGLGIKLRHQTLSEDSLHLTDTEIENVIAFMKSLSDR